MNSLNLTVVNDVTGDQCGSPYQMRCDYAESLTPTMFALHCLSWVNNANYWMVAEGHESVDAGELIEQAQKVYAYYTQHMREIAA